MTLGDKVAETGTRGINTSLKGTRGSVVGVLKETVIKVTDDEETAATEKVILGAGKGTTVVMTTMARGGALTQTEIESVDGAVAVAGAGIATAETRGNGKTATVITTTPVAVAVGVETVTGFTGTETETTGVGEAARTGAGTKVGAGTKGKGQVEMKGDEGTDAMREAEIAPITVKNVNWKIATALTTTGAGVVATTRLATAATRGAAKKADRLKRSTAAGSSHTSASAS